jgi:hypothetical protein
MMLMQSSFFLMQLLFSMLLIQGPGDDPGMPGGDPDLPPDLPETPLDSGVYLLIVIALLYGVWRIRKDLVYR